MGTMKYQKSMLKIYELLILNKGTLIIEDIIKKANIGRTSGFKAIKWLNENGFINIRNVGKQKEISIKKDIYTFQLKCFLDALRFKSLNEFLKYTVCLFIENLKGDNVKSVVLFGSSLSNKEPKDIDLLIIYKNKIDKDKIIKIKDNIEMLTEFVINLHFDEKPSVERLLNSICVFGFEYYIKLIVDENKINIQFLGSIDWFISAYNNIKDKDLFKDCLENTFINLGFAYSLINGFTLKSKEEAKSMIFKEYRKLNKLKDFDNYKKLELIKEVIFDIGKKIFK